MRRSQNVSKLKLKQTLQKTIQKTKTFVESFRNGKEENITSP